METGRSRGCDVSTSIRSCRVQVFPCHSEGRGGSEACRGSTAKPGAIAASLHHGLLPAWPHAALSPEQQSPARLILSEPFPKTQSRYPNRPPSPGILRALSSQSLHHNETKAWNFLQAQSRKGEESRAKHGGGEGDNVSLAIFSCHGPGPGHEEHVSDRNTQVNSLKTGDPQELEDTAATWASLGKAALA